MKNLLTLLAIFLGLEIVNAQKEFTIFYEPDKETKDIVYGFPAEFKLSASISAGEAKIILEDYLIDQSKGFFKKFGSEKKGKFYPCSSLKNLCNQSKILSSLWIEIIWEYNGNNYSSGSLQIMLHNPKYINSFGPPGEIGYSAVKEGKAKIAAINFKAYSTENTDAINNLIYDLKK